MDFLILLTLILINIQLYKLSKFVLTVDQQELDIKSQDFPTPKTKE